MNTSIISKWKTELQRTWILLGMASTRSVSGRDSTCKERGERMWFLAICVSPEWETEQKDMDLPGPLHSLKPENSLCFINRIKEGPTKSFFVVISLIFLSDSKSFCRSTLCCQEGRTLSVPLWRSFLLCSQGLGCSPVSPCSPCHGTGPLGQIRSYPSFSTLCMLFRTWLEMENEGSPGSCGGTGMLSPHQVMCLLSEWCKFPDQFPVWFTLWKESYWLFFFFLFSFFFFFSCLSRVQCSCIFIGSTSLSDQIFFTLTGMHRAGTHLDLIEFYSFVW